MLGGIRRVSEKCAGLPFPNARAAETNGTISRSNFERKGQPILGHDNVIAISVGAMRPGAITGRSGQKQRISLSA
jgi:hypothetical protein